jgi:Fe-S cluster biogenesis protein NfuA
MNDKKEPTATEDNSQKQLTTEEKIDGVLEKLRPFLAREGGDIRLDHFDKVTGVCYVDMTGACAGCALAASDVSDSIEVMLMDEIPEISKVELIAPTAETGFDDLLRRLAEQQQAQQELDEMNAKQAEEEKKASSEEKKDDGGENK